MPLFSKNLGVDLGTVNVLIYEGGQSVLQEPSLVAVAAEEDDRGRINVMEIGQLLLQSHHRAVSPLQAHGNDVCPVWGDQR